MRIWDTEHNNGVLIYLQLAEHQVEVVADRGLARQVPAQAWEAMVDQLTATVKVQGFEAALHQALDEVDHLLRQHFALDAGSDAARGHRLSNAVVRC